MTNTTSNANAATYKPDALGVFGYSTAWFSSCARSIARLTLRPMRRTRQKVSEEYDVGRWGGVLAAQSWQAESQLRKFLIDDRTKNSTESFVACVDGVPSRLTAQQYYEYRIEAFAQLLGKFFDPKDDLVELGCGYGYNLFSLAVSWPQTRFLGFDISSNAVQAVQKIAKHFGLSDRMQADVMDVTDQNHPNLAKIRDKNVLTFFCIEQIPYDVGKVVDNLLAHHPKRVVHAEPGTALLKWWKPSDWPNFLYLRSVDYQNELLIVLRRLEQQGKIRILQSARMPFAPSLQNSGQLTVWEPT